LAGDYVSQVQAFGETVQGAMTFTTGAGGGTLVLATGVGAPLAVPAYGVAALGVLETGHGAMMMKTSLEGASRTREELTSRESKTIEEAPTGEEAVPRPAQKVDTGAKPSTEPVPTSPKGQGSAGSASSSSTGAEAGEVGTTRHVGLEKADQGSYTVEFESGKSYAGKGGTSRARRSARQRSREHSDPVKDIDHTVADTDAEAFVQEAERLDELGGPTDPSNYNKVNSPGKKIKQK
jgi:hypothetical protein